MQFSTIFLAAFAVTTVTALPHNDFFNKHEIKSEHGNSAFGHSQGNSDFGHSHGKNAFVPEPPVYATQSVKHQPWKRAMPTAAAEPVLMA